MYAPDSFFEARRHGFVPFALNRPASTEFLLMRFARFAYTIAAIYGFLLMPPLYFMERKIGIDQPPAITHPEFFYGFIGVVIAWQLAFLIIGRDPVRYRPLMLATMIEKFSWAVTCSVLYLQQRLAPQGLVVGMIDLCLGISFVIAYARTAPGVAGAGRGEAYAAGGAGLRGGTSTR